MASTNLVPEILQGQVKPDEPTAVAVIIDNQDPQTAGRILSVRSGNQEKAYIDYAGVAHFTNVVSGAGATGLSLTRATVANADYTTAATDTLIAYTSLTVSHNVTLTHPSDVGHVIVIKDESGSATPSVFLNITDSGGAANMQGGAAININSAYGSVRLYWSGAKWFQW